MNIHICLLSDQLLANLLPVKTDKPDAVFLIGTAYTEKKGLIARFENILQNLNIKTMRAQNLAPDDDFEKLSEYFLELSTEIKQLNADVLTLNITGGTKLMSIAAFQMLASECARVIYTNTQAGKIDELNSKQSTPLPSVISIDEYLQCYGVAPKSYSNQEAEWVEQVNNRRGLSKELAQFFGSPKNHLIPVINSMAKNAIASHKTKTGGKKEELVQATHVFKYVDKKSKNILKLCDDKNILEYDGDKTITFTSLDAAKYMGGFWIEEYAFMIATELNFDEVRCGQSIQWDKQTRNELDIVIVHNNRLLIIECKTSRFGRDSTKDNDIIYKLDSIAEDLRGLYGSKWLLSVDSLDERTQKRAKSQNIKVIDATEICKLKQHLQNWKENPN